MIRHRVIIIGEGPEEKDYLERLKSIGVFSSRYEFIPESAGGITNISARYQEYYEDACNYLVLVFCDTEKNNSDYQKLKADIDDLYGFSASSRLIFYASPCTMLILLNHFVKEDEDPIPLAKVSKSESGELLIAHGISIPNPPYAAKEEQRKAIMNSITKTNYRLMKNKIAAFTGPDTDWPCTNALTLFDGIQFDATGSFVEDLVKWIDEQRKHCSN